MLSEKLKLIRLIGLSVSVGRFAIRERKNMYAGASNCGLSQRRASAR